MNVQRPNRPNRPSQQDDARQNRTIESDVPQGRAWVPSEQDTKPLRKDPGLAVPDFIPLDLSNPQNQNQAEISKIAMAAQGRSEDFDPSVDREDDVVGTAQDMLASASELTDRDGNPVSPEEMRKRAQAKTKQASTDAQNAVKNIPEHPVLQKLRQRFGIASKPIRDAVVGGIRFSFRQYSNNAYIEFVVNRVRANILEGNAEEFAEKLGYGIASIAIAAIEGVPAHEVFGVEIDPVLEKPMVTRDPLHPPTSVVVATAEPIYSWLIGLSIPELGDTLVRKYGELFPQEQLEDFGGTFKYACPAPKCSETQIRVPRYDATGKMKVVYCPVHGIEMRVLGSMEDLADIPLA